MKKIIFTLVLFLSLSLMGFSQSRENSCSKLKVSNHDFSVFVFSVEIDNFTDKSKLSYEWHVEGGKIIYGKDKESIVFLSESNAVFVNVKIEGLPETCKERILSYSVIWDPPLSSKMDQYSKISKSEEIEKLDNISNVLKIDPFAKVVFKLNEGKELIERLLFLSANFQRKNIDRNRIIFTIAKHTEAQTEIWLIPNGARMPDCENCLSFESKDFEKLRNLFQPKSAKKSKN